MLQWQANNIGGLELRGLCNFPHHFLLWLYKTWEFGVVVVNKRGRHYLSFCLARCVEKITSITDKVPPEVCLTIFLAIAENFEMKYFTRLFHVYNHITLLKGIALSVTTTKLLDFSAPRMLRCLNIALLLFKQCWLTVKGTGVYCICHYEISCQHHTSKHSRQWMSTVSTHARPAPQHIYSTATTANSLFTTSTACGLPTLIQLTARLLSVRQMTATNNICSFINNSILCIWHTITLWVTITYRREYPRVLWTPEKVLFFTARCTLVQSAVLLSYVVCPSVRPSECDVQVSWSRRLEFFENNFTAE